MKDYAKYFTKDRAKFDLGKPIHVLTCTARSIIMVDVYLLY